MKKFSAWVLVLIMVFSIGCAFATNDSDTIIISTLDEASTLGVVIAEKEWEPDLTICAFGYWLLSEGGISKFGVMNVGLYKSELNGDDCKYYWSANNGLFSVITNHVTYVFPGCDTKDDYAAYLLLFTTVMDAEEYTYSELSGDA